MAGLSVENLKKSFGGQEILKGISFDVKSGEFLSLLGPSGCGKTTILRIICGLESADSGTVCVDGEDISRMRPEKRNIGLVFQNYALFPSMNVARNVGYGLRMQKVSKEEINDRVSEVLKMVKLSGYENRKIAQLSGGEQQRVALARALITKPNILLLDEPLSALDRKVRAEMQYEIRNLQREIETTTIFVTHDQEEALTMSDNIVLMNQGVIEQEGDPYTIYSRPATIFASDFLGKANLISGTLSESTGKWYVSGDGFNIEVNHVGGNAGDTVKAAARGEYFTLCAEGDEGANPFRIEKKIFTGLVWKMIGMLGNEPMTISVLGTVASLLEEGSTVYVRIKPEHIVYYTK